MPALFVWGGLILVIGWGGYLMATPKRKGPEEQ
jgi:hypothetical protein